MPRCCGLQCAHDVSSGLAYLHPSVIHRDLKPSNILIDEHGRFKIADFGISRVKVGAAFQQTAAELAACPAVSKPAAGPLSCRYRQAVSCAKPQPQSIYGVWPQAGKVGADKAAAPCCEA